MELENHASGDLFDSAAASRPSHGVSGQHRTHHHGYLDRQNNYLKVLAVKVEGRGVADVKKEHRVIRREEAGRRVAPL
jgi:hypothetical protein